jgi:polysaccharide pyruvyl transferase WcaK-like protein
VTALAQAADLESFLPAKPMLVVGGYGYRNAGDEAILAGLLKLTGRDGVTVVSRSPAETAAIHDVHSISIAAAAPAMPRHRGLLIGGGGLFGADMGLLGRLLPLGGIAAAAAGREVALIGVGIDRRMPRSTRQLLRWLGGRARSVVVRDGEAREVLAGLGIEAVVRPDLSSLVGSAGPQLGRRLLEASGMQPTRRPVVGLALTAVDPRLAERVERAVLAAVDALPEVDFALLPMSRHPFVAAHNDEVFARRLAAAQPRLRILPPPDDPARLLGLFEALGAAVCMRYHSLLFAERAAIPMVPVAYAEKCRHWLGERGLESLEPSPDAFTAAVRVALARSPRVAPVARRGGVAA